MQYEYPSTRHSLVGYPYRVWIFSILTAPLLKILFILSGPDRASLFSEISILDYLVAVLLLTPLLIPAMIVYMLFFWRLINLKLPRFQIKILLGIIGILLLSIEFALLQSTLLSTTGASPFSFARDSHFILLSSTFFVLSLLLSLRGK